jgi:putative membrane protein
MPSEHRLHPYSMVFAFLAQIRLFVVPGILVAVGATRRSDDWSQWQPWMMLLVVPNAVLAIVRYLTYSYRFDAAELVIHSGLLFRRERHIPYSRIQNIDAIQNVLHRVLGVAEVKIETGGGERAEATMSVLPLTAFAEMRRHVFAERDEAGATPRDAAAAPAVVHLSTRDLLVYGFIESRGGVLIAAILGLVWEFGLAERVAGRWIGPAVEGRPIRALWRQIFSQATLSSERIFLAIIAVIVLLVIVRMASMLWALIRLHGFTLTLMDDDLRREFGLFTHVALTIPRRRIQMLTVRESPLHRVVDRVAITMRTAGGGHREARNESGVTPDRDYLAPLLERRRLTDFLRRIIDVDLEALEWQPVHPRAFRREVVPGLVVSAIAAVGAWFWIGWYALCVTALAAAWAVVAARQGVKHLRWAVTNDAVCLAGGWLWRRVVVVRFAKMQVVTRRENPFDRRHGMASVDVDTAGSGGGAALHIPYLARHTADALSAQLAAAAAATRFSW